MKVQKIYMDQNTRNKRTQSDRSTRYAPYLRISLASVNVTMRNLILLYSFLFNPASVNAEMVWDWIAKNEPLVKEYVGSLSPSDSPIEGVKLSNQKSFLAGYIYLGKVEKYGPTTHLHIFKLDDRYKAIIWVLQGGKPLPLPGCAEGSHMAKFPWFSGAALSGDVYTYPEVHPDIGIVISSCPSIDWIKGVSKSSD